jgi:hypothetical protein
MSSEDCTVPQNDVAVRDNDLGDLAEHALQASLRWFTVAAGLKTGLEYECKGQGRNNG